MIDLEKIPKDLKNYLITIVTLPFWYISVYYFFETVYLKNDFVLIGSICISLAIISNFIASIIALTEFNENDKNANLFQFEVVMFSTFIQCFWLSILIFLGYLSSKLTGYKFEYYGFLIVYFIGYIAYIPYASRLEKNNKNK